MVCIYKGKTLSIPTLLSLIFAEIRRGDSNLLDPVSLSVRPSQKFCFSSSLRLLMVVITLKFPWKTTFFFFKNKFWEKVYGQLLVPSEMLFICAEKTPNLQVLIHSNLGIIFQCACLTLLFLPNKI